MIKSFDEKPIGTMVNYLLVQSTSVKKVFEYFGFFVSGIIHFKKYSTID